ncbi:MAG TPA: RsmD family RNA methyltransferase [Phycisphaerae bacterium]|nr:RsmD family RNA methyltransferase [Phycisphaerae bacterium]
MRIIAGRYRGRRIRSAVGQTTRPMPDRVRQAVFDILGARWALPGELPPIAVLDLFAGSGMLGLEALSRGARYCCFVERDRRATRQLEGHIGELGLTDSATILAVDALAISTTSLPHVEGGYDLVFLDPPYRASRDARVDAKVGGLLARVGREISVSPEAVVVLRHETRTAYDDLCYGLLRSLARREYGTMAVTFLSPVR